MNYSVTPIKEIAPKVDAARAVFVAGVTRPLAWRRATLERIRDLIDDRETRLLGRAGRRPRQAPLRGVDDRARFHDQRDQPRVGAPRVVDAARKSGHADDVQTRLVSRRGGAAGGGLRHRTVELPSAVAAHAYGCGNRCRQRCRRQADRARAAHSRRAGVIDRGDRRPGHRGCARWTCRIHRAAGPALRSHPLYREQPGRTNRDARRGRASHAGHARIGRQEPSDRQPPCEHRCCGATDRLGKFLNAGQTCIAPDYVLVESPVHDELVAALGKHITEFYGPDPQRSPDYARIVNEPHFHRLEKMLHSGTVAHGGASDADTRYIAPTVMTDVTLADPVMREEIFGPILPIIEVESLEQAIGFVNELSELESTPLALYTFSEDDSENDLVVAEVKSGGACVNGTLLHVSNPNLPFGGVGESGMGAYHGKFGFDTFSHHRAVHTRTTRIDPPLIYPPYTTAKQKLVRKGLTIPDPRDVAARLRNSIRRD